MTKTDQEPLTEAELDELRAAHRSTYRQPEAEFDARGEVEKGIDLTLVCRKDRHKWPCETSRLLATLPATPSHPVEAVPGHTSLETFGHAVGIALADRKVPDDLDAANLTPAQMIEATCVLLDRLDDATDAFLATNGADHRVGRSMQRDLRAIAAALSRSTPATTGSEKDG